MLTISLPTHEAFAIWTGRRGILNPTMRKLVELSIRRSGDRFVVGAPNEAGRVRTGTQLAALVRHELSIEQGVREFEVAVDDHFFNLLVAFTKAGPRVRHTLGGVSDWIEPPQLSNSLTIAAAKLHIASSLDSGVRLTIKDVSDVWKETLDHRAAAPARWRAVLSHTELLTGLPTEVIEAEVTRRIWAVDLPMDQPKHIQNLTTAIATGRKISIQEG